MTEALVRQIPGLSVPKARRTQTDNAQLYLAEPYFNKDQVAYAMNNAEPLCAGVWGLGAQLFSIILISRLLHMREMNMLCHRWLNYVFENLSNLDQFNALNCRYY